MNIYAGNNYVLVVEKDGYSPVEYHNVDVSEDETVYLGTIFMIPDDNTQDGTIKGTITNSLTGEGVDDLEVKIRRYMNNIDGEVLTTGSTNNDGKYEFTIESGQYTVEVSGEGYITTYFNAISIGGEEVIINAEITPVLPEDQIRIVLTWGETPRDLDSHMTGPKPDGSRFHVYYSYKIYEDYVGLDLDDTSSHGPETITIYRQIDGVYRYFVHDYSNGGSSSSTVLSNSGAVVKVYMGNTLARTFNVPSNQGGTLWTVFELEGNNIKPINTLSFESPYDILSFGESADIDFNNLPKK